MVDQILAFIFVYPSAPLRNRHANYIQVAWLATCSAESIPILRTSSNIYIYSCFLDLQNIQHLESVWNPHVFETSSSSRIRRNPIFQEKLLLDLCWMVKPSVFQRKNETNPWAQELSTHLTGGGKARKAWAARRSPWSWPWEEYGEKKLGFKIFDQTSFFLKLFLDMFGGFRYI